MTQETSASQPQASSLGQRTKRQAQAATKVPPSIGPVLEQLANWYPQLFGARFVPLKRGIFQDLLAAHPALLTRDLLKAALAWHTRSTRYLAVVAAGQPRYDLAGNVVEPMAFEHVQQALLDVFRRRQARSAEDLRPALRARLTQVFQESGLSRQQYAESVLGRDELALALWQEIVAELDAQLAKDEALKRAFDACGQTPEAFAEMYGLDPLAVTQSLRRAARA